MPSLTKAGDVNIAVETEVEGKKSEARHVGCELTHVGCLHGAASMGKPAAKGVSISGMTNNNPVREVDQRHPAPSARGALSPDLAMMDGHHHDSPSISRLSLLDFLSLAAHQDPGAALDRPPLRGGFALFDLDVDDHLARLAVMIINTVQAERLPAARPAPMRLGGADLVVAGFADHQIARHTTPASTARKRG